MRKNSTAIIKDVPQSRKNEGQALRCYTKTSQQTSDVCTEMDDKPGKSEPLQTLNYESVEKLPMFKNIFLKCEELFLKTRIK